MMVSFDCQLGNIYSPRKSLNGGFSGRIGLRRTLWNALIDVGRPSLKSSSSVSWVWILDCIKEDCEQNTSTPGFLLLSLDWI